MESELAAECITHAAMPEGQTMRWARTPRAEKNPSLKTCATESSATTIFVVVSEGAQLLTQKCGPLIDPEKAKMWTTY